MRSRRFLALLMSIAIMVTSGGFSSVAYAATPDGTDVVYESTDASEPAESEVSVEPSSETDTEEADTSEIESVTDDETEVISSEEESSTEQDISEDITSEEADTAEEESLTDEAITDKDAVTVSDDVELLGDYSKACFAEVGEDGILKLKDNKSLTVEVLIPKEARIIPANLFTNNTVVKYVQFEQDSQLTTITAGAFQGCSSLIEVTGLPSSITAIPDNAFSGCSNLKTLSFTDANNSVATIGDSAFKKTVLENCSFPNVTDVGDNAFAECKKLITVSFPKAVTIGEKAFENCSTLEGFSFAPTITSIGEYAFRNSGLNKIEMNNMTSDALTIGSSAFAGCSNVGVIKLPSALKVIPDGTFADCTNLTRIEFGTGNEIIKNGAFSNCKELTAVNTLNVYNFEDNAFAGCTKLGDIYIKYADPEEDKFVIKQSSFPQRNNDAKMHGYNGKVQDYAEKRGYKFITSYAKHDIKAKYNKKELDLKFSVNEACKGDKIKIEATPVSGFALKSVAILQETPVDVTFDGSNGDKLTFSFIMPDNETTVVFTTVAASEAINGKLACYFGEINGYSPSYVSDKYEFDKGGREAQLYIKAGSTTTDGWLWTYSSNNTKVAAVSSTGIVRAVGEGTATITVTLKADTSKKISVPVRVGKTTVIGKIVLGRDNTLDEIKPLRSKKGTPVNVDGIMAPVFMYDAHALQTADLSMEIPIAAYADDDLLSETKLTVSSSWTSSDKKIAYPASSTCTSDKNTIVIKKGAVGEAMITVTVKNKDEKEATAANTKKFIIKVVDPTPRLTNSTLTVNSLSTIGTELKLVTVYGYAIKEDNLVVCTKKTSNNGVEWPAFTDLAVHRGTDGKFYLKSNADKPFASSYKDKLYIEGEFTESGENFHIALKEVTVNKTELNPKLKASGKINLFYDVALAPDESGSVKLTPDLKNLNIEKVELISEANFKKKNSEAPDKFANNFAATVSADKKSIIITRKAGTELLKDSKNKVVSSGYVRFKYEGYTTEFDRAVTLSVSDTAPAIILKSSSANASIYKDDAEFELSLVDKKTKKISTDMTDATAEFTYDTQQLMMYDIAVDDTYDVIRLSVKDGMIPRQKGKYKASFNVKRPEWSRSIKYTFTINFTDTRPTAKFKTAKAVLNKTYAHETASLTFTQNMTDAVPAGFGDIQYTGSSKSSAIADILIGEMDKSDDDTIVIKLPSDASSIPNGTYKFKVTPKVKFNATDEPVNAKNSLSFSVVVGSTTPSIKLKKTTFTLNSTYSGSEEVSTAYTLGNLPTGVSAADVDVYAIGDYEIDKKGNAPDFDDIAEIVDISNGQMTVKLKELSPAQNASYGGKTYSYTLKNLVARCNETDAAAEMNKVSFSIKLNKAEPTVKLKASGTINPVDTGTAVTYTAAVSNIVSSISSTELWEVNSATGRYYTTHEDEPNNPAYWYSPHFDKQIVGGNKIIISARDGAQLKHNKKYKLTIVSGLTHAGTFTAKNDVTVTPKQTVPKVTTKVTDSIIYAGQDERTVKFTIKKNKPGKNEKLINAVLEAPVFAKGTSKSIENAFTITGYEVVDPATGEIEVTMVLDNPSSLVLNKKYDINLVTRYAHQDTDVEANKFKVSVTVNK